MIPTVTVPVLRQTSGSTAPFARALATILDAAPLRALKRSVVAAGNIWRRASLRSSASPQSAYPRSSLPTKETITIKAS